MDVNDSPTIVKVCRHHINENACCCFSVVVVCRQGNDSQTAVQVLKEKLADLPVLLKDMRTGLNGWAKTVDSSFPQY